VAEKPEPVAKPGRRQAHKIRTERALQQAALKLFAEHGYDTTTTDEIAEAAGVSPRTFFRYFPTKESVLFVGEYGWFESFTKHYLSQPDALGCVEALRQTLIDLAPELTKIRRSLALYERAVASSPTLRGRVHDHQQQDIATLGGAIAERSGFDQPDERSSLLAAICLVAYRRCLTLWLAGPASVDPSTIIARQFDLLGELFAPTPRNVNGRRRQPSSGVRRPRA
jgi:AcrR family transcriptional regulator